MFNPGLKIGQIIKNADIVEIFSLSSTTHNFRNIDKNKQKRYNRSARKKAEKSKKACTRGGAYV